jgi:hypothetical protein
MRMSESSESHLPDVVSNHEVPTMPLDAARESLRVMSEVDPTTIQSEDALVAAFPLAEPLRVMVESIAQRSPVECLAVEKTPSGVVEERLVQLNNEGTYGAAMRYGSLFVEDDVLSSIEVTYGDGASFSRMNYEYAGAESDPTTSRDSSGIRVSTPRGSVHLTTGAGQGTADEYRIVAESIKAVSALLLDRDAAIDRGDVSQPSSTETQPKPNRRRLSLLGRKR